MNNRVSTYEHFGLPNEAAILIFTLCIALSLVPFIAGADFGVVKVPSLPQLLTSKLRLWGPLLLVAAIACFYPVWPNGYSQPFAEKVYWDPTGHRQPGIFIEDTGEFIPWPTLKEEVKNEIEPYADVRLDRTAEVEDWDSRPNLVVVFVTPKRKAVASLWFGPDPHNNWVFDGKVRVGQPVPQGSKKVPIVWETFQRLSNGTYEKVRDAEDRPPIVDQ